MIDFPRFLSKFYRWKTSNKIAINLSHFGHHCNPKQISQKIEKATENKAQVKISKIKR
jgi:hypothetical protein